MKNIIFAIILLYTSLSFAQRGTPITDIGDGNDPYIYVWYLDADIDGLGNPAIYISTSSNFPPVGYVNNDDDCDDNDELIGMPIAWYPDNDGDGYGERDLNGNVIIIVPDPTDPVLDPSDGGHGTIPIQSNAIYSCTQPIGYVSNQDDCNDNRANVNILTWYEDADGDGFGNPDASITSLLLNSCQMPGGYSNLNSDCNDQNPSINPNTEWFLDNDGDGIYDVGIDSYFLGCSPPNSNYISFPEYFNLNWIHTKSYDVSGNLVAASRVYYDEIGRSTVSLTKDFHNQKMWGTENIYDSFGRVSQTSFPTISQYTFRKIDFLSDSSSKTQYLDPFYSDNNPYDPYQATASHPYTEVEYDKLNPGNVIKSFGGNQINGEWKSGYSYTVPAAQEMYYLFGHNYYNGPVEAGKEEIITKFYKTVSVDANGVENVAFSDGEGKTLALARSGITSPTTINPYPVHSLIGIQGYVDVCIPPGITSGITLIGGASNYDVYNLRENTDVPTTASLSGGNCYRIVAKVIPIVDPKVYVTQSTGVLSYNTLDPAGVKGISYNVNYYDYSFNIYDNTGRLKKSVQPNGFTSVYPAPATLTISAAPSYMSETFTSFSTTYNYNTLGQLIQVSSPDEGTSKFAYRNDGQIRYSQSALQATQNRVSYTNYDNLSRPIESGVFTGTSTIWNSATTNVDNSAPLLVGTTASERTFTIYDYVDNIVGLTVTIPSSLSLTTLAPTYAANQKNLAGNVAVTYKADLGTTITNITWYSYDIYDRVEWLVKYDSALGGVKTIDYVHDKDGNVKQVIFQKNLNAEKFTHQYTYDANGRLTKVETASGTNPLTEDAQYTYNTSDQLNRVRIGETIQGIDYVYTLGGTLKSINHPSLETSKDPGRDGMAGSPNSSVAPDIFGITLDYFQGDYNRASTDIVTSPNITPNYSGNIMGSRWAIKNAAMDWPSPSTTTAQQKGYLYDYNRNNWLTEAKFGEATNTGSINVSSTKHREQGLEYDSNGNITKLQRTNDTGATVDNLNYNYTYTGTNRLNFVSDQVNSLTFPNDIDSGQLASNYVYNVLGQLTLNEQEKTHYVYNTQGLVIEIRQGNLSFALATANIVKFYYNEMGHRVRKEAFVNGTLQNTTYYVLDAGGNTMAIYSKPIGGTISQTELPIYGASRLGVCNKAGSNYVKYYQLTDHLGNVRAVAYKNGSVVTFASYADYYPFGEPLNGRNSNSGNYRYAFQGQEKDPETGMEAFQLRMWDGRLGRWLSPDPYGQYASPYLGMGNNPINGVDPDGGWFWKRGAEKARQRAIDAGYDVSEVKGSFWKGYSFDLKKDFIEYDDNGNLTIMPGGIVLHSDEGLADFLPANISQYTPNTWSKMENNFFGNMIYQPSNGVYAFSQIFMGRSVGNGSMRSLNGSSMTTDGAVGGVSEAAGLLLPALKGLNATTTATKGGGSWLQGGKTFTQYKAARGGTETLAKISTSTGTQRISTEFHHVFLTQRIQRAYNLPNWAVNNRLNVWKLNTVQHSLIDPYRYNFLRAGFKPEVGWIGKYNWFTKF